MPRHGTVVLSATFTGVAALATATAVAALKTARPTRETICGSGCTDGQHLVKAAALTVWLHFAFVR